MPVPPGPREPAPRQEALDAHVNGHDHREVNGLDTAPREHAANAQSVTSSRSPEENRPSLTNGKLARRRLRRLAKPLALIPMSIVPFGAPAAAKNNIPSSNFSSSGWAVDTQTGQASDVVYSYYPFLTISNLPNIPPQDVNFLELQGCLRVPTRALLDEFLQQYFLHVHPLLPLVNEGDFWDIYRQAPDGNAQNDRVSLLVFQAIVFASCNFVSRATIKALGYPSIRSARASLYRRAKLLYDLESESSPLAIAQAALLLSFWSPSTTRKPNTAWLSLAIQHAKSAEAHHYAAMPVFSASTHPLQHRKQNILKRIWWCCIIRDRTLGLLMRRPIQITRAHFDFDENPTLGFPDLVDEFERSRVYNAGTKRCLAEVLAQLIELYVVLTDILMLVFPLDDTPGWGREMKPEDAGRVRECKVALRRWYKDATLRFPMFGGGPTPASTMVNNNGIDKEYRHDSVILYTNLMYMYYHSTRVVLCHHEVLHLAILQAVPNDNGAVSRDLSVIYENRHELQDAASGVTECLKELVHLKLARWLPISAVACTALPLVLNILDVKLSAPAKNSTLDSSAAMALKQHRLNILIEAMRTYQPQYDGVDWVSEIVRHIVNLAQIDGSNAQSAGTKQGINDWTDILASQPGSYLRLALALDLSLSKGRLPEDGDFPVSLRGLFTGGFSPLKSLVEANRAADPASRGLNQASQGAFGSGPARLPAYEDTDSQHSTHSPEDSRMTDSDDAANEALRDQIRSQMQTNRPVNTNIPPSQGLDGLGPETGGVFPLDDSPGATSDFGGMYIDGPMPDISAEWIESLWGEMGDMEDKTDRDTARVLLEALKEGDRGE